MVSFSKDDIHQLLDLWRTALVAGAFSRYDRLQWAANKWSKLHPGEKMAAYRELDAQTRGYGA